MASTQSFQNNINMKLSLSTMIHVSFTAHNVINFSLIVSPYIVNLLLHLEGLYATIAASCHFLKPV